MSAHICGACCRATCRARFMTCHIWCRQAVIAEQLPYGADRAEPGLSCPDTEDESKEGSGLAPSAVEEGSRWASHGSSLTEEAPCPKESDRPDASCSRAGSEVLRVGSGRKVLDSRESSIGTRERGGSVMIRSSAW